MRNLFIFGSLFIVICIAIGLTLAIFLDQKISGESLFRTMYLYPMALSFIVTGAAWRWILNQNPDLERLVQQMGFTDFMNKSTIPIFMDIYSGTALFTLIYL